MSSSPPSGLGPLASAAALRSSGLKAAHGLENRSDCVPDTDLLDRRALEDIYRTEAPQLVRYFRRRTREADDALDLVHESFVRLATRMRREILAHPASYLQRIARNLLIDRSKRSEARLADVHVPIDAGFDLAVEPEQCLDIDAEDVMRLYRRALDALPEKTREVFLLHRVDELTYSGIGKRLGISVPTVQYHVAKALVHLDKALERK